MHLSDIFQRQHHHFMFRGALATFGCGIGAFLGDLIHGQKGIDARIELSTTGAAIERSEEHTSELQSLMRNSYAVFCLKKKNDTLSSLINYCHQHLHANVTQLYTNIITH